MSDTAASACVASHGKDGGDAPCCARAQTGGKGVHLALNSLADDKLQVRSTSWQSLAHMAASSMAAVAAWA